MLAPFRIGVRAFLGPYELVLARIEGHYHTTGGGALFLQRVRAFRFPTGEAQGSVLVFVDSLYPSRKVPLEFELDFPPVADEARVNGLRLAVRNIPARPRVSVPPTGRGSYVLAIEVPGGSARFELGTAPPSTRGSLREVEPPPAPSDAGVRPLGARAPEPMEAVEPFLERIRDRRFEDAYALCAEVMRSVVPLHEFTVEAAAAAGMLESLDDWSLSIAGGAGPGHPYTVGVEVFRAIRHSEPAPRSLVDRVLGRRPVRTWTERSLSGVAGSLTLGPAGGRLDILAFSLGPFAYDPADVPERLGGVPAAVPPAVPRGVPRSEGSA